jgi:hypothetical protein
LNVELLAQEFSGNGFGAFDGAALEAVPDEARENTQLTGNTKENSVEVLLSEAVVLEEDTRVSIDVGVRVLGLTVLSKDTGHNLIDGVDELEEFVVRHVLLAKGLLARVARIGLAEDGVTVARDDTLGVEEFPGELGEGGFKGSLVVDIDVGGLALLADGEEVRKDFLVGETVEGTSKTVHTSGEGIVRVRKSGTDESGGVSRNVATFVVSVDGEVEAEALLEGIVVHAHLDGEVGSPILVGRGSDDVSGALGETVVDHSSDGGSAGNAVERVIESESPVVALVGLTLRVSLVELGASLESEDTHGELSHGVSVDGGGIEDLLGSTDDLLVSTASEFLRQGLGLGFSGDVTGEEEPEHSFRERFAASLSLGELLLALGDGEATEADTFLRIKKRGLVDERADIAHTTISLFNSSVRELFVTILGLELLDLGSELGLLISEDGLEFTKNIRAREASSSEGSSGENGARSSETTEHC